MRSRILVFGLVVLLLSTSWLTGCAGEESLCSEGSCPSGTTCDDQSGRCVASDFTVTTPIGELGRHAALAVTPDGELRIAAYDSAAGALLAGSLTESGELTWLRVAGGAGGQNDQGSYPSLALDGGGQPRLAFYDATAGQLKLARLVEGAWAVDEQPLDPGHGADVGRYASLAVDSNGGVHVAYRDETNRTLRIVSRAAAGCHPPGDSVGVPRVVSNEEMAAAGMPSYDYGEHASIAIGLDGTLVVSFYDATRTNLVMATCAGGWLDLRVLDGEDLEAGQDTGDVGLWSSLAVDQRGGTVGVAYYDRTRGVLKYAGSRDGAMDIVTVDDGVRETQGLTHIVGQRARLDFYIPAAGFDGLPRIAYLDSTARAVRLARRSQFGAWDRSQIIAQVEQGGVGLGLDLAFDGDDIAHLVFGRWRVASQSLAYTLHLARCDASGCAEVSP